MKVADALKGIQRIYLDTAPVIYYVQGSSPSSPVAAWIFDQIKNGSPTAVTGPVTLAETLVQPYRTGDMRLLQLFRDLIIAGANTQFVAIGAWADKAAELRARYGLLLMDAFQVACALTAGCDALLTNDLALKRVKEIPILVLDDLEL